MESSSSDAKRVERVVAACIQCRSRHVKCDGTQPTCNRCRRDGKACTYTKSRRGGLDKAALARRRLRLQQEAGTAAQSSESGQQTSDESSPHSHEHDDNVSIPNIEALNIQGSVLPTPLQTVSFAINEDRLVELYYENFYPALPITLPLRVFMERKLMQRDHGTDLLLLVMHFVGAVYAPWTISDAYYQAAYVALSQPDLPRTGFTVQALIVFSNAQMYFDLRSESRKTLDLAISIGLGLGMNSNEFAYRNGEGSPVLEESLRRTYYFLHLTDLQFAVIVNNPFFTMRDVPNHVDLPCDDEYYESENIPPASTWRDYQNREFDDIEVIYSSIVYLYDVSELISHAMRSAVDAGSIMDVLISDIDTKVAIWQTLLPACKKEPLRLNGEVDEVMFLAHLISTILLTHVHRPFSSLVYSVEELSTNVFAAPVHFVDPPKQGRGAHTARTLKAVDVHTKLLAIPCKMENHHLFTMCITSMAVMTQIASCNIFLEDHALSIARDRVRLSIGYFNQVGTLWPLAKKVAKEVRYVARKTLTDAPRVGYAAEPDPTMEIEIPRDELIWPVAANCHMDIYSGMVLPIDWSDIANESSSTSSIL